MSSSIELQAKFESLVREHGPGIRRLAHVYIDDPAHCEDLFQEIALAIWTALPRFRGESTERTWVYRIAHNVASTERFKVRKRSANERRNHESEPEARDPNTPESGLRQRERRRQFVDALRQLPTIDFQIVSLHLEGLSYAEIGEVIGLTQTNVGARLTRARQALSTAVSETESKS